MPAAQTNPIARQIGALVTDFTMQVTSLIEQSFMERVMASMGETTSKKTGRPPARLMLMNLFEAPRKKAPVQLCPVPGCKNRAAPVFHMLCLKHKDTPKEKVREYRKKRHEATRKALAAAKEKARAAARKKR